MNDLAIAKKEGVNRGFRKRGRKKRRVAISLKLALPLAESVHRTNQGRNKALPSGKTARQTSRCRVELEKGDFTGPLVATKAMGRGSTSSRGPRVAFLASHRAPRRSFSSSLFSNLFLSEFQPRYSAWSLCERTSESVARSRAKSG